MGLTFKANGSQPGSTVVLRRTGTNLALGCGNTSVLRSFTITPTVSSGLNANVSFTFNPSVELNGLNQSLLELYNGNDSIPASTITGSTISYSGIDSVSVLTAAIPAAQWLIDADGDGYTLDGSTVFNCTSPGLNYVATSLGVDCDDSNPSKWRTGNFYADADGDTYRFGSLVSLCYGNSVPLGYIDLAGSAGVDCDDTDALIYTSVALYIDADGDGYSPGQAFVCIGATLPSGYSLTSSGYDGCDNDALAWNRDFVRVDNDNDGYSVGNTFGLCYGNALPAGYIFDGTQLGFSDCDDNDSTVNNAYNVKVDSDGDGYSTGITTSICAGSSIPAGYVLASSTLGEDCDDNDPLAWSTEFVRVDNDNDGYSVGNTFALCYGNVLPTGYILDGTQLGFLDCDDNDSNVYNTYNVKVDNDGDGYSTGNSASICAGSSIPSGYVLTSSTLGEDCDDNDISVFTAVFLYVDADGDGYTIGSSINSCIGSSIPSGYSTSSLGADCNDSNFGVNRQVTLYADADGDGYSVGAAASTCIGAAVPSGYSSTTSGSDCNDADNTVWISNTFYVDADGDGYHGSSSVICYGNSVPAGSISTLGLDCNDGNNAINPGVNEICDNFIDDDCDALADEYCNSLIGNDSPTYAVNMQYSTNMNYPNCYAIVGTLAGATDSPQSAQFTGPDNWYKFVAQSTGVSVTMTSAAQDDVIEIYQKVGSTYQLLSGGAENAANGAAEFERLNYNGLTIGQTYFISVGAFNGVTGGTYSLCIQHLMASGCASVEPVAGFSLCDSYRSRYRGATSQGVTYSFEFAGIGGGATGTTSISGTNGLIGLSNPSLALRWGGEYNVSVDVLYNITNSAGIAEPITIDGLTSSANCSGVTMAMHPMLEVRSSQRCSAALLRSNYLIADRVNSTTYACGAINYSYEFSQVVSCANGNSVSLIPVVYTTPSSSPYLALGVLPNLPSAGAWNVKIRPNFSYGPGTFGPTQRIQVNGTSASVEQGEGAIAQERQFIDANADSHLYPNPSNGSSVMVSYSNLMHETVQVRVMDAMGKMIQSHQFSVDGNLNTTLTFENKLASGLYFIEMNDGDTILNDRLIVE
jgi:hypothetical protein